MKRIVFGVLLFLFGCSSEVMTEPELMENYVNTGLLEVYPFDYTVEYIYSDTVGKDVIISQSIEAGLLLQEVKTVEFIVSKGMLDLEQMKQDGVNEYGRIPFVMYHGIEDMKDDETPYNRGNVDYAGYNRTLESFKRDMYMFLDLGYVPISMSDYVNNTIDIPYGKSPIVLTFDDSLLSQFQVFEENGKISIDPKSVIGIFESLEKEYQVDMKAIFYLNSRMFDQREYIEYKLNYLVENGYELGNHTYAHLNLSSLDQEGIQEEIGRMEAYLHQFLPDYQMASLCLPFGAYPERDGDNFKYLWDGEYEGITYHYDSVMMVGWMPEQSPNHADYKTMHSGMFMRVRGSDLVGSDQWTDLDYVFNDYLSSHRYISDGDSSIVVGPINYATEGENHYSYE